MSKIVKVINVMISQKKNINKVISSANMDEIFFNYNQYKWSISKNQENNYYLHYYPGKQDIKKLASWPDEAWHEFNEIVSYNTKELGTKEAYDSLGELYSIVKEKTYGMDEVFEDIIKSDVPF